MQSWMDVTVRPTKDAEVAVEPGGAIEIHFKTGPKHSLTVLLGPEIARRLVGAILEVELTPEKVKT